MASIAVMNAKGGVGKSTLTMALAETLSAFHDKSVLLIDADGQMSLSLMMMPVERLNRVRAEGASLTGFLNGCLEGATPVDFRSCVTSDIGDVDDTKGLYLIPGDMDLPLIEREIVAQGRTGVVRKACRHLLDEAARHVDFVLVDCAPGISVVTECWLRECDLHLVPVKPDVLGVSGMQYLRAFRQRDPNLRIARHLGIVVNMKQPTSDIDQMVHDLLAAHAEWACFDAVVPMIPHIQKAALFSKEQRSYQNKYPAEAGRAIRALAAELLRRLGLPAGANAAR